MVVARSLPALVVVSGRLLAHLPDDAPGPEWVIIKCASKDAYGCGKLGEKLLEGLTLYVRRVGSLDVSSSLSISLSDEALRSIQAELLVPEHLQGPGGILPEVKGYVQVAKGQVLVLLVIFRLQNLEESIYYLVYDATDASLYMIPYIPSSLEATCTTMPVLASPASGRGHELALAARKFWPGPGAERGRVCLCTPATRENPATDGTGPWAIKVHRFPELPQAFLVDVMFSLGDKVFWADLSQGVAYSDLRQGGSVMDVGFIKLPDGYRIVYQYLSENGPAKMSRTMGCVQGSIKFVCINCSLNPPGNKMVKVWTLDLDRGEWKEDEDFTCPWEELWMKVCNMNSRLKDVPPLEPQYPVLMPDGAALCLLLPKARHRMGSSVKRPDYICSFDMLSKSCLGLGHVRNYHLIEPVILPSDFFMDCYPGPLKRNSPTLKRKLPSISRQDLLISRPAVVQ